MTPGYCGVALALPRLLSFTHACSPHFSAHISAMMEIRSQVSTPSGALGALLPAFLAIVIVPLLAWVMLAARVPPPPPPYDPAAFVGFERWLREEYLPQKNSWILSDSEFDDVWEFVMGEEEGKYSVGMPADQQPRDSSWRSNIRKRQYRAVLEPVASTSIGSNAEGGKSTSAGEKLLYR